MVPNIDGTMGYTLRNRKHPRHGTQCVIQDPTSRNPAQSLQENAITVFVLLSLLLKKIGNARPGEGD